MISSDVLVVFPHRSTFIDQDLALLRKHFDVAAFEYRRRRDVLPLLRRLRRCRVAMAWFALGYSYPLAKLQRRWDYRSILIAAGWDVEAMPELGYGAMLSEKRLRRTAYALGHADTVLAVSDFTRKKVLRWAPTARVRVVSLGFDPSVYHPDGAKERRVLTVARVGPETVALKGIQILCRVAARLPDVRFQIAGRLDERVDIGEPVPENLEFCGFLPTEELIRAYQRAKVYAQLSAVESFGASVAEAMLCDCVPVVTDRGALPEVVGDAGIYVPYGDVEATAGAIERGLESDLGPRARQRVATKFPVETREAALRQAVDELLETEA